MSELSHYVDRYWNDLPGVLAYLCRRATGDPDVWWLDYLTTRYATPPRQEALVIGCGNGWVDRELIDRGIAEHVDAFDVSDSYLKEAEELRADRPIHYFKSGFGSFNPNKKYDLIVNVAALHHAQQLHRICHVLAGATRPDGIFVNWEYVGPDRNQYPDEQVAIMAETNAGLPERFRTPHPLRPRLTELLAGDVTEAVHSAEVISAVEHYFRIIERRDLGGGVAYQILWNNIEEFAKEDDEANKALAYLLELDEHHTTQGTVPVLFSFFICQPRLEPESLFARIDRTIKEPLRERFAQKTGGVYPKEALRGGLKARPGK